MFNLSETVDKSWSPYYFVLIGFRYGYADNLPNFTVKADADSWNYEGCGFDIGWAVDENRQPVSLDHIDFVRVYSGLNQKCPAPDWWGETSTEIQAAEDLHLEASIEAAGMESLQFTVNGLQMNTPAYDLHGRRIAADKIVNRKSLYIQNGKKYLSK